MSKYLISLLFAISMAGQGVVVIPGGIGTIPGSTSSGGGAISSGTTLPASCTVGSLFFKTDATAGQNIYGCTSTNTWTLQSSSAASGFSASISSSTVLAITAGISRVGTDVTSTDASTATISGSTSTSTAYAYIDSSGVPTIGHNGASTITSAQYLVVTGISGFPDGSQPLFEAQYVSNAWTSVVNKLANTSRSVLTSGVGILITENAGGDQVVSATGGAAISPTIFLPHGTLGVNLAAAQSTFTANQTRWTRFTLPQRSSFTGMGLTARLGIGGGKGLRFAIADTSGAILYKTSVNTTCAGQSTCRAAFSSVITLDPGDYYIGLTTDSTAFYTSRPTLIADEEGPICQAVELASPAYSGTGTIGTGAGASVDFGASMGSITSWSCDNSSNTFLSGYYDVYLYN